MKKSLLLETAILITGTVFLYNSISSALGGIVQVLYYPDITASLIFRILFFVVAQLVAFILLVKYADKIADYFIHEDTDSTLSVKLDKAAALHIIIIAICIYSIISALPPVLLYCYEWFSNTVDIKKIYNGPYTPSAEKKAMVLQVIVSAVAIVFAKDIAGKLLGKNEISDLVLETEEDKETNNV